MTKNQKLQLAFLIITPMFILYFVILAALSRGNSNINVTTTPTQYETGTDNYNMQILVAQFLGYDSLSKELTVKLSQMNANDCTNVVGNCAQYVLDQNNKETKKYGVSENTVFKILNQYSFKCQIPVTLSPNINKYTTLTLSQMLIAGCGNITSDYYFIVNLNGDVATSFEQLPSSTY